MANNLEATITIDASPAQVWSVVSDLRRMPEWSPQCRAMRPVGKLREGGWTLNLNRQGWKFWPTMSKIVRYEANRSIGFRVLENGTVWSFDLSPDAAGNTELVQRRTVPPQGTTALSRVFTKYLLGGNDSFEVELVEGMNATLAKIKTAVER